MHYERLTALDNSFLVQEGRTTYMHIASTAIFAADSSLTNERGGVDIEQVRRYVASRLHYIPRYRQRLARIPVSNEPIWVDDTRFDIAYHVRHASLPRPGTDRQLREFCARVLERHLDRERPLWECWLVEGLEHGRFAMITKAHHCMVDGIGGVELMAALLTLEPQMKIEPPVPWSPEPAPGAAELLRTEVLRRARAGASALSSLSRPASGFGAAARDTATGLWSIARTSFMRPTVLPFNGTLGPHRRIEWLEVDLAAIKQIRNVLGGTINDVVLATVAGAMHRFLAMLGIDTAAASFRAAVPVSVRPKGQSGDAGNQVSAWLADLPVGERDPWRRLSAVRHTTNKLKISHQAEGARALTEVAEWTGASLLGLALRVLHTTQPYNVIVTNVPGPPVPLHLLDARIDALYPHLPLFSGQGLGIALLSYAGTLFWGLTGDWELVPQLADLRLALVRSCDDLCDLAATVARNGLPAGVRSAVSEAQPRPASRSAAVSSLAFLPPANCNSPTRS